MTARLLTRGLLAAAAMLAPAVAMAHTGSHAGGLMHGFAHPVSGFDHILAMLMVGAFAWQLGGRALWLVPASFVTLMAVGGALGAAGLAVPFVEIGIALSVVVLGAVVALGVRAPLAAAMAVVGLFALFHGHAHGAEMPAETGAFGYAAGFMIATALLHVAGISIGALTGSVHTGRAAITVRTAGGIASAAGIGLLFGLV
ncbi:MAG: HupE/UreJ family protein [Acetobacteraceae bacterium]